MAGPCWDGDAVSPQQSERTVPPPGVSPCLSLQRAQKGHKILLLWVVEFDLKDHIEERHGILQGQEPPIMQVGRGVLDAP